ncbi:MAG: F0F1 ATP synthase subunit A [Acidimicrobiia bacterium]|nr:F0F1 ATP synthase subunit A [Acidimicrobiia bacterium]MYC57169.1 F0F1 ATP synthase subunit A [Acidimicrobiia bacterium]MYG93904.1 F0F1 ATP synthase subunit A [Acidimicrobiia bacterium]MYI29907.1 F0F1 ATP synthase subunit A [Acidimicrobiia bacterium]
MMNVLALEFPPVTHLFEWPDFLFTDTPVALNKTGAIYVLALLLTAGLFWAAGRRRALVPVGAQTVAETGIEFVESNIIMQTIGPDGRRYLPLLTTMFFFIFFSNIFGVIPLVQFPANSRMAIPLALALVVWVIYHYVGIRTQGFFGYFKGSLFPPGVPWPLYILVAPIELLQILLIRPLSLAIRLWANMVAGHLLLVSFAVLSAALWGAGFIPAALPFFALILITAFEIFVSALQAFIFTILTAVYIGGSLHPQH